MADYDSDSSAGGDDIETNVLLGYASKDATDDSFSQLGGHPTWLDDKTAPDGNLAKCKVCNGWMNLLLQLNGDLPSRFAGHDRRLYLMMCKRKACRRKAGNVRGFRATRIDPSAARSAEQKEPRAKGSRSEVQPPTNLGNTLFGVESGISTNANPFGPAPSSSSKATNPFAPASSVVANAVSNAASAAETLPQTFAEKARISASTSTPSSSESTEPSQPPETWPETSSFPPPYPSYYLDADKEFLEPESDAIPSNARVDRSEGGSGSASDEKSAFESSMDKTFQRFADRLAQNPEQVLRYEFKGQPLLYSKTDAVGKLLGPMQDPQAAHVKTSQGAGGSKIPRCNNCGTERVFELQLTPNAITELESEDMSLEGMDWGTIILGVCSKDCLQRGKKDGEVGYLEEWVGVQWEEVVKQGRADS